jgi:hypothetical protein
MTFEAIDGAPLGPKFPVSLSGLEVDGLIAIALALPSYRPRRRWFRRLHVERRLRLHHRSGLIGGLSSDVLVPPHPRHGTYLVLQTGTSPDVR